MARFVFLLLLLGFTSFSPAADANRLNQEDDIREAVFRHQFDHNASGQQKSAHAYCLAVLVNGKDADPSDQFMQRFSHHKPPVRKASACHWTSIQIVENYTGRSALLFRVSKIIWASATEVTVDGGYDEGNVSSSGNTYTVRKQNGKWAVTSDQMNVISEDLTDTRHGGMYLVQ
jgi:hypothetical protein